jgi:hypothetical protein
MLRTLDIQAITITPRIGAHAGACMEGNSVHKKKVPATHKTNIQRRV